MRDRGEKEKRNKEKGAERRIEEGKSKNRKERSSI
jgi:hypothetical protein